MKTRIPTPLATIGLVAALTVGSSTLASPRPDGEPVADRKLRYAEGFSAAREGVRGALRDENEAAPRVTVTKPRGDDARTFAGSSGEFWVFDATTELFFDDDGDGYYHALRVTFDADTLFTEAYVYAELYLSWDGETWERYFVTEDFLIEGSTSLDEYEVETEFVTGYPTGLYDVLIELYDADFGDFVAEFGPLQSSDFSLLPIEDLDNDPLPPIAVSHEHGGAGSSSWLWLGFLMMSVAGRRILGNACSGLPG